MSNEELIKLYRAGKNKVLENLIEENKGLVFSIVNKFYTKNTSSIDIEDLQQEGTIGLIEAINKYDFDNDKRASFSTYAVYRIYQKISNFIRDKNTNDEISLNTPTGMDDNIELMDTIEGIDYSFENVEDKIYRQQLRGDLEQAMRNYNSLYERELLMLRYGWNDNKECTYKDIADIFNSNSSKVSADEHKALRKLRISSWGVEKKKEYFGNKLQNIMESSKYNQDSAINAMSIVDKYFSGVL